MYDVMMIDPPWPRGKGGLRAARPNQGRDLDYNTMSLDEIFFLLSERILPQANRDHSLFVWTIDKFLIDADLRFADLGYKRHARLVWDKGNGVAPAFTVRFCHEYCIWYYKEKLPPVATDVRGKFGTVLQERSREHSRKPDAAYLMVDALYPTAKKYDVFSREPRGGWDQFGNQINWFVNEDLTKVNGERV